MDQDSSFSDLTAFTSLPRLTGLALSPDGTRLVATVQQPDEKCARYASSIWEIPVDGGSPARLTRSDKGETSPAFLPDGTLLFVSARPDPHAVADDADTEEPALWKLPAAGDPQVLATGPGGLGLAAVARDSGTVIGSGRRLAWTAADGDDAARRRTRKERKVTAILHTGMPIRYWDHELGEESPRLLRLDGDELHDLTPAAGQSLHESSSSISADGAILVTTWRARRERGRIENLLVCIDVASGIHTVLADENGAGFHNPKLSPDGTLVAVLRHTDGSYDAAFDDRLQLRRVDSGAQGDGDATREVELGDVSPNEWAFSADGAMLFVAGDLHGRGAVLAVDAASGAVVSSLVTDASYSSLCPAPDGRFLYALRSTIDEAPAPVRLDTSAEHQVPRRLASPAPTPALPGSLVELNVPDDDGRSVHGWLCLPPPGERPAPLMLWIHGGPFSSYNSWSWRWNPWTAVARGYAVLMPDPALSTGYGLDWIRRAWPHRAELVWRDLRTVLDAVETRPEIDARRTACLGASFGGYMSNWVAGHTDRFDAIVTHAGLWALDQQHTTTDGAQWKTGVFGTPAEHPDWYADNSPHNFVEKINTPMLIVHGNRDYRVPISEALRLWWDLVRHHSGDSNTMPHRFLQLTSENHWVLSPANAEIWYDTVLGFCDRHVRGLDLAPSELL